MPTFDQIFNRFTLLDQSVLTRHLAIMLRAGVPLTEAIQTLSEQERNVVHRKILADVLHTVESGHRFTEALKKTKQFDKFYISMVDVGESSGSLEENLRFLSQHLSRIYALRQKVVSAMMYPAIVFLAMFILGMGISLFILPQLVTFFESFETELPLSTKVLLTFANFMRDYGIAFFAGVISSVTTFLMLMQQHRIKPHWHAFLLRVPLFGKQFQLYQQTHLARNLSVLLRSGVPISNALATTGHTLSNLVFKRYVTVLNQQLVKGETLTQVIQAQKFTHFSPLLVRMIAVGEKTGKLPETLEYVAEFLEEEIEYAQKNMTTLLEPILLVVIGVLVGFIALAIISPIYELTGSLGYSGGG